jgi:hypothetical protein
MIQSVKSGPQGQSGPPDLKAVLASLGFGGGGKAPAGLGSIFLIAMLILLVWGVLTSFCTSGFPSASIRCSWWRRSGC